MDIDRQLEVIRRVAVEIISEPELVEKLRLGRPLRVKAGFDPTTPDLHLGHTVLLRKLRQFQELDHRVIFLIGDATALVGDPSGQSKMRKLMTHGEVMQNALTYIAQVQRILKVEDAWFECRRNSEWFVQGERPIETSPYPLFTFAKLVELMSRYTVARLIERDDFQKRLKAGQEVSMLELFYPLMQGYDSVMLQADVELGGVDQKFNLLVGRDLQRAYGQTPQVVVTVPLLVGTDGVQKMSKSLGNHIGIHDNPDQMYGKLLSIPDKLMWSYFELLTDLAMTEIEAIRQQVEQKTLNPKHAKDRLARLIVTQYHGVEAAEAAAAGFDRVFRQRVQPEEMLAKHLSAEAVADGRIWVVELLRQLELAKTGGEARRAIEGGGVQVDGERIDDPQTQVIVREGTVVSIGRRRFAKVTLK